MIYAIFSDIHGNLEALTVAINYIVDLGITDIICCGDITGYGPNPQECIQFLQRYSFVSVAGNHDRAIVKDSLGIYFNEDAVIALNIQKLNLNKKEIEYIKKLPKKIKYSNFVVTHSSLDPKTPYRYVIDENSARNTLAKTRKQIVFNGHSHIPTIFKLTDNRFETISAKDGLDMDLSDQSRYIINVGSVGQPRDGSPEISFGLYDNISNIIRIVRLPYDFAKTQEKMKQMGFPEFLVYRIGFGV